MITAPTDLLPVVAKERIARTLAADRYLELPDPRLAAKDTTWRQKAVSRIVNGHARNIVGWDSFIESLREVHGTDHVVTFTATLSSRLLVNVAGTALENGGLSLDRNTGQPCIPGSALKGIARAQALRDLHNYEPADQPTQLSIIADAFGWAAEDWSPKGDYSWALQHNAEHIAETKNQLAASREHLSKTLPAHHSGSLNFLPAYPKTNAPLVADVLTPHHADYYKGNRILAIDDEQPNPILFPAVEKGSQWAFTIVARNTTGAEIIGIIASILGTALKRGLGAKTAAGYGQFDNLSIDCEAPLVWRTAKLTFNAPAFLAGANPAKAEVRSASLRGALRWWFRVVGGTSKEETQLFGGLGAKNAVGKPTAACLALNIRDVTPGPVWSGFTNLKRARTQDPLGFTAYTLKASGNGIRVSSPEGHLPPGTTFTLQLLKRYPIPAPLETRFALAWKSFLLFGGIGYRSTRGYGSFSVSSHSRRDYESVLSTLATLGFSYSNLEPAKSVDEALIMMDRWIKARRSKTKFGGDGIAAKTPNPLGSADNPRQASGIHFRVLRTTDQPGYALLAFAPPPGRVLNQSCRIPTPADLLRIPLR